MLDRYPVMRRTMESVAAERLTKIGKNPSIVSSRADLEDDQKLVNEIVMESTPIPTSASDDDDRDSDDSSDGSKHKKKSSFKFDFANKLHKISEERKHKSKEHLKETVPIEFEESKHPHGHAWTKLPKVYSGSNLFGLKVPGLPERKRSGSVGDAYSLANTRLTQSLDEADEDEYHNKDTKRRGSFLGGRLLKSLELKDVKAKQHKEDKKTQPSLRERKRSFLSDHKENCSVATVPEENASLMTLCEQKDCKDATVSVDNATTDFDPSKSQSDPKTPASVTKNVSDVKPQGETRALKSSLKLSSTVGSNEPAKIVDVECSEVGSTQASTGSADKSDRSPKEDDSDATSKDTTQKDQSPKVVFFTDPIVQAYIKTKSNTS